MKLKLVPSPENNARNRRLGQIGESLAMQKLIDAGFRNVKNLNDLKNNYEFADIYAEKSGKNYVISVKTRRKFERLGGLNAKYNLGKEWKKTSAAAAKALTAIPAWIEIQVDGPTFSLYFGLLSLITESNGIPMESEALTFYECLAKDEKHNYPEDSFTPRYQRTAVGVGTDT